MREIEHDACDDERIIVLINEEANRLTEEASNAYMHALFFFFASRRRHTRFDCDWSSDVCSSDLAGRDASAQVLNVLARNVPWLIGGSADLAPSTKTRLTLPDAGDLTAETPGGRNLHFGIREHAMGAVLNGLSLSKVRAFGSGFLIFSDYGRPALRLAALMEIPVIYAFSHAPI